MGAEYDTVIIIAPSHKKYFEGAAIIEDGGYKTPLGIVEIDREATGKILKHCLLSLKRTSMCTWGSIP